MNKQCDIELLIRSKPELQARIVVQFYLQDFSTVRSIGSPERRSGLNYVPTLNKNRSMSDVCKHEWRFCLDDMIGFTGKVLTYTDDLNQTDFKTAE